MAPFDLSRFRHPTRSDIGSVFRLDHWLFATCSTLVVARSARDGEAAPDAPENVARELRRIYQKPTEFRVPFQRLRAWSRELDDDGLRIIGDCDQCENDLVLLPDYQRISCRGTRVSDKFIDRRLVRSALFPFRDVTSSADLTLGGELDPLIIRADGGDVFVTVMPMRDVAPGDDPFVLSPADAVPGGLA